MATGCIVGTCPVCDTLIWEDEMDFVGDRMLHNKCKKAYIKSTYHMSEAQYDKLVGVQQLRQEVQEMKQMEEERHNMALAAISHLEGKIDKLLKK